MRLRRLIMICAVVTVAVLAAGAAYLLLPPSKSRDVALPPDSATPEQVVKTYLAALDAHDCGTARALSTNDGGAEAKKWCDDVSSLTDITVHHHFKENPAWSGNAAPVVVVDVPVQFKLHWRTFHNDGSMGEGPTGWGYLLMRSSPDAPWRIFDQGAG